MARARATALLLLPLLLWVSPPGTVGWASYEALSYGPGDHNQEDQRLPPGKVVYPLPEVVSDPLPPTTVKPPKPPPEAKPKPPPPPMGPPKMYFPWPGNCRPVYSLVCKKKTKHLILLKCLQVFSTQFTLTRKLF